MNKTISAKMQFSDDVEYTSTDVKTNKFLIYYRKNGELQRFELPLNLIQEFIYIDQNEINKCPICESDNLIINKTKEINNNRSIINKTIESEKINPEQIIEEIINDINNSANKNDPNWECLSCGANKESLELNKPEISYTNTYKRLYDKKVIKIKCNGDIKSLIDDSIGYGKLSDLQIQGNRQLNTLHWFRVPFRLNRLLKDYKDTFNKTIPLFKWREMDRYLYLEYLWYIDGKEHQIEIKDIDDVRVCDIRYLRPPRTFNREYLKYKYPKIWTLIDADFKWKLENNYCIFQIKWDKQKYLMTFN